MQQLHQDPLPTCELLERTDEFSGVYYCISWDLNYIVGYLSICHVGNQALISTSLGLKQKKGCGIMKDGTSMHEIPSFASFLKPF